MSAKKNWSLVLELTEQAPGERHVAEAHVRFKRIARRYTRRAMKQQLDELLVELVVDRFLEKRRQIEELNDLHEWEAAQKDFDRYQEQQLGYDDESYFDECEYDDRRWLDDFAGRRAMERHEHYMDDDYYCSEQWDEHPLTVELSSSLDSGTAEQQKADWLNGRDLGRWRR